MWIDAGPARGHWTLSISRHARLRGRRRIDSIELPLYRGMVELSLRHGTWLRSTRRGDQIYLPVLAEEIEGWLCGTVEKARRPEAEAHVEVVTCFGSNYNHVREALEPIAHHPCPAAVLVNEAEAVSLLGGPHGYLAADLERRFARETRLAEAGHARARSGAT